MLLVVVYLFSQYTRKEEVSRAELVDCLRKVQKEFPLGYEFPEKLPYVPIELDSDLDDFCFQKGYLRHYRYGSPLAKNFVALWPLGRGCAKKIIATLSLEITEILNRLVKAVIKK